MSFFASKIEEGDNCIQGNVCPNFIFVPFTPSPVGRFFNLGECLFNFFEQKHKPFWVNLRGA